VLVVEQPKLELQLKLCPGGVKQLGVAFHQLVL
jgi:hypothetical protein